MAQVIYSTRLTFQRFNMYVVWIHAYINIFSFLGSIISVLQMMQLSMPSICKNQNHFKQRWRDGNNNGGFDMSTTQF